MCEYIVCVCVNLFLCLMYVWESFFFLVRMLCVHWCMHVWECGSVCVLFQMGECRASNIYSSCLRGGRISTVWLDMINTQNYSPHGSGIQLQAISGNKEKILSEATNRKFHLETKESVRRCWPLHFVLITRNSVNY